MELVLVEWLDAISDDAGWKKVAKLKKQKPVLCRSVGWIVNDTAEHITVAASIHENDCDGDVTIPRGMVQRVIKLKEIRHEEDGAIAAVGAGKLRRRAKTVSQ